MPALLVMFFCLFACSSAPPPPTEANGSGGAAEPAAPVAPAKPDREQVAQAALDAPPLQQYFHDRSPIHVVVNRSVNPAWSLTAANSKIEWVDETSDKPRIEFTLLRVEGDKAAATLRYDIEGIVMHIELRRAGDGWKLVRSDLAER